MYFGPLGIYGFLNPALLCAKDFHGNSDGKVSACNAGDSGSIPGWEDPLEKEMATHSSILSQRIPWTEDPVGDSPWVAKRQT